MVTATWLAATASLFKTRNIVFDDPTVGLVRILEANPLRFYVRFSEFGVAGTTQKVYSAPPPTGVSAIQIEPHLQEWKYKDAPSIVTGEFYMFQDGAQSIMITESVYVGA